MKKILLATLVVTGFALSSAVAIAQTTSPAETTIGGTEPTNIPGHPRVNEVDQRDNNQQNRINAGEADGQINKAQGARDERRLHSEERTQKRQEAHDGGHLTKREQRRDNKHLNKSSHKIHRQRHGHHHEKK